MFWSISLAHQNYGYNSSIIQNSTPTSSTIDIIPDQPILILNYYNLDPNWRVKGDYNRVLLENELFERYPVAPKNLEFIKLLGTNIKNLQIYVGSFESLIKNNPNHKIIFKEHPLNDHYKGTQDSRDWMFEVEGYFSSFFAFWKKCKKQL